MPEAAGFQAYFFDLDGTIFLGDRLLPGVRETLARLREQGKEMMFLSNTTTRTRTECLDKLRGLGLEASLDEVVTAAYMAAVYLSERSPAANVLAIGEHALCAELDERHVRRTTDPAEATHVLVGMDRRFDYGKIHLAMTAVRNGALLIAANPDPYCPLDGDAVPDTWSMVKAIEAASEGTVQTVIGKPSAYYANKVLQWGNWRRGHCLMVGDRYETDMLLGIENGIPTALVLTGVTSASDLERYPDEPDYAIGSLDELLALQPRRYNG
ncbi:Sugar-phosphatase AraL [Paenibacillus sp. CECT 9249]|uniref:HAD-IIA family hydrolase n=1 Tax=Paenibacillus sp. CECT 9249 TaxID=2845385 RepID=UPI001E2E88B1|nr:HAD-IIA family hydrolase [Paenibacillus sp. CECT 9249]CAH0121321.1 Sugar-phosphatase AraL [Paenibacillus sp. CECT 9249]